MTIGFCTQHSNIRKFAYVFIVQLDMMGQITP